MESEKQELGVLTRSRSNTKDPFR